MSNKDRKATMIFSILAIGLSITIYLIVAMKFFTKDNRMMKSTVEKKMIACKQQEKIVERAKEVEQKSEQEQQEKVLESTKNSLQQGSQVQKSTKTIDNEKTTQTTNKEKAQNTKTSTLKIEEKQTNTNENIVEQKEEKRNKQEEVSTTYKGLKTIGKIEIPKTGLNIPILDSVTANGMEIAPCFLYSTGELNKKGNTLIVGHNYNNIFTNNKKLEIGDKIVIITLDGKKVEYTIYKKFITNPEDLEYVINDSTSNPKIMLSTCTSNDKARLVIMAK